VSVLNKPEIGQHYLSSSPVDVVTEEKSSLNSGKDNRYSLNISGYARIHA
jgi:hypothetical protein